MNIVIVGCGGHARSWLSYIKINPHWKLVGIIDTDTEKLMHPDLWDVPEECAYPSIEEAVKFSDEPIDAVLLTTPIPTHHLLAINAMELGLNVICEKSMAETLEEGQKMVKVAQNHPDLCTVMGTQYRFRPMWWTLKTLLQDQEGPIGKVAEIKATSLAKQGNQRSGWRAWLPEIYPLDMMVHHIDSLRYCTGMNVVKIQAFTFIPYYSGWLGASTVMANMALALPGKELVKEDYVYMQYHGDWQSRGLKRSWEDDFEFIGQKGSLRVEPPEIPPPDNKLWEQTSVQPLVGEPSGNHISLYQDSPDLSKCEVSEIEKRYDIENNPENHNDQMYILDELAECIESKGVRQPQTHFAEGFKSFVVSQGAMESSRTGKTVWLPKYWPDPIPEP